MREDLSQKKQNFQSNFAEVNKADLIFRELRFWTIKNSQKFSSKTPILKLKAVFEHFVRSNCKKWKEKKSLLKIV